MVVVVREEEEVEEGEEGEEERRRGVTEGGKRVQLCPKLKIHKGGSGRSEDLLGCAGKGWKGEYPRGS